MSPAESVRPKARSAARTGADGSPAPPRNLVGHVLDAIGTRIVGGTIPPGDPLPTEMTLGAELGVSRTAVREAIKILTGKGLVESRQKTGTRILPRSRWNILDPAVLGWQSQSGAVAGLVRQLQEVRRIVEPAAAALAAERATAPERRELLEIQTRLEASSLDPEAFGRVDLQLHRAILAASHNEFIAGLANAIDAALMTLFRLSHLHPEAIRRGIPLHRAVSQQIARGNARAARRAMEALLDAGEQVIEELDGTGARPRRDRGAPKPT